MIGDSDGAICMYEEMIAIFDRLGIKNLANVARSREAQVYLQMDRVKKALEISRCVHCDGFYIHFNRFCDGC